MPQLPTISWSWRIICSYKHMIKVWLLTPRWWKGNSLPKCLCLCVCVIWNNLPHSCSLSFFFFRLVGFSRFFNFSSVLFSNLLCLCFDSKPCYYLARSPAGRLPEALCYPQIIIEIQHLEQTEYLLAINNSYTSNCTTLTTLLLFANVCTADS